MVGALPVSQSNNSVQMDGPKLRFWFPPLAAPAVPHAKRCAS